jgi:hypothetical protein
MDQRWNTALSLWAVLRPKTRSNNKDRTRAKTNAINEKGE